MQMAKVVALTHHEKWNGCGYPHGLAEEDIPRVGRIVAIADVFDALTSQRPYKPARPVDKAIGLLKAEAGKHFDPQLVSLFLETLPEVLQVQEQYGDNSYCENRHTSAAIASTNPPMPTISQSSQARSC